MTSTASFMLCPCFALTFTGQGPNITSSFTNTSFVRSNVITDTSTISQTYLKWKHRWSQSLCCNYTRWCSRIGCMQRNIISFFEGKLTFIVLQPVSQQELDACPCFLWHLPPVSQVQNSLKALTPLLSPQCKQHGSQRNTSHPVLCPVSSLDGSWARVHPEHTGRLALPLLHYAIVEETEQPAHWIAP